jgi:hypothetical protein
MAAGSDLLDEVFFNSEVDEKVVSDLMGSLESQLAASAAHHLHLAARLSPQGPRWHPPSSGRRPRPARALPGRRRWARDRRARAPPRQPPRRTGPGLPKGAAGVVTPSLPRMPSATTGGIRAILTPIVLAPRLPQPPQNPTNIQNFQLPPGMVLVQSENGQLLMIPQQALSQMQAQAHAQAQPQSTMAPRPATPQVPLLSRFALYRFLGHLLLHGR